MLLSFLYAVLLLGLPILCLSYLLMRLTIDSEGLEHFENRKDLQAKLAKIKKAHDKDKNNGKSKIKNPIARKWFNFGGGFYGLMAFFTYILIEIGEIADFIRSLADLEKLISNLGIELLFGFIINSIMNFIYAMIWFITLPGIFDTNHQFLWLIVAYVSYLLGARLARDYPTMDDLLEAAGKLWSGLTKGFENTEATPKPEEQVND